MSGLYIHIPFCRQKCYYCNFYSLASQKYRNEIIEALLLEIDIQKQYLNGEKLDTIYFGGGTPSLYEPEQIQRIIQKAVSVFGLSNNAEITLEANPDDIKPGWLQTLTETSINRLSIGIQSFYNDDLKYLNRIHNALEALEAISLVQKSGFSNLSVDLIYGIPTLDDYKWRENIKTVLELNIPHISAYALTVESGTTLDHFIRKKKYLNVDDHQAERHFNILMELLNRNGYEHYEISNFAKPGQYAKHNTSYWQGKKYLGLGPSAHSYNHISRQWNIANIRKYLDGIKVGVLNFEKETLSKSQQINEYIMTSLRTMWGMDMLKIEAEFGSEIKDILKRQLVDLEETGYIFVENKIVKLTLKGKLFADGIASRLFI